MEAGSVRLAGRWLVYTDWDPEDASDAMGSVLLGTGSE